jgi:Outer membrane lipoprotein-sorting protein
MRRIFFAVPSAVLTAVLFFAVSAAAETTNTLSDAEIQGRKLAQQLCEAKPETGEKTISTGTLTIRNSNGSRSEIGFRLQIWANDVAFSTIYEATSRTNQICLGIVHFGKGIHYALFQGSIASCETNKPLELDENQIMIPFANSDFWVCDLGLEFFHWPEQKILPKPTNLARGRDYTLLESTNPNPSTNAYSRVLSWIDKETDGILQAEAYDFNGKLLKEFAPKSFKKVNGQWQLQEMDIRNVQTGSRTWLEFDLKK